MPFIYFSYIFQDISGMMGKPLAQARGEINGMEERTLGMINQVLNPNPNPNPNPHPNPKPNPNPGDD